MTLAYMLAKKGYLPHIVVGARIVDETHDGGTRSYVVKHQPCPKFRIILPLQEPWVAADFASQSLANATWKNRIGALAHALGLQHDQSCVDTSRLYYLPRHPAGAPFVHTVIHGEECPLWTLPDVTKTAPAPLLDALQSDLQPRPQAGPQLVRPDHLTFSTPDGSQIDLTAWAAGYARRFEIVKALRARAPQVMATRVNGVKQHITCPHAGDHFTGGTDKTGTFVVNSSQIKQAELGALQSGFVIHCSHNGCAGRDRLSFLQKMLEDQWLSIADLTHPEFLTPEAPPVDFSALIDPSKSNTSNERQSNIASTLYADLPGIMEEIHTWMVDTSPKPQPALCLSR